jgi:RNA polymerase sigma-70 factor (ECF subfamily)
MPENAVSSADSLPGSSLVEQLRTQSPEGWQRFLDLYGPLVYSWCRACWRLSPPDAADVLQDVALRVFETIGTFRGGNFAAWLWQVTRSRVSRHVQRQPAQAAGGSNAQEQLAAVPAPGSSSIDSPNPVTAPAGSLAGVLRRAVERVRGRANPATWTAFWQVVVEGRTPADVAGDLGLSVNAVYLAVSRISGRLREEMGHLERESSP